MRRQAVCLLFFVHLLVGPCPAGAQQVIMPLERYEELREKAAPQPTPTPAPAMAAAIDSARIEVQVGAESARVVQELSLSVLAGGWQSIGIPPVGTFISADLGDLEGRVSSSSAWALTVRGRGRHTVRLESLVALQRRERCTRPTATLDLALPRAAVIDGVVRGSDWVEEVEFVSNGVAHGRNPDGGWRFTGRSGESVTLRILGTAPALDSDALPLRFEAATGTLTRVSRTRSRITTWMQVTVLQGELEELRVPVPQGLDVVAAEGELVAGWDVDDGDLLVTALDPVRGELGLRIDLAGSSATEVDTPMLVPAAAVRTLAAAAITVDGDGLLELVDEGSGRVPSAADRRRLPAGLLDSSPFVIVIDEISQRPRWRLTWSEGSEVLAAQVDRLRVEIVVGEAGLASYRVWAWVRSSGAGSFEFGLPPGLSLVAAGSDGVALRPGVSATGLVLPLTSSSSTEVLFVEGLLEVDVPQGSGGLTVPLPRLSAPAARIEARLGLPPGRRYELEDRSRAGRLGEAPVFASCDRSTGDALVEWLASGPVGEGGGRLEYLAELPRNFVRIEASWSALTASPDPLRLKVEGDRVAREWF